jgi:hypothetical protein
MAKTRIFLSKGVKVGIMEIQPTIKRQMDDIPGGGLKWIIFFAIQAKGPIHTLIHGWMKSEGALYFWKYCIDENHPITLGEKHNSSTNSMPIANEQGGGLSYVKPFLAG